MITTMQAFSRWRASAASETNLAWSAEALQERFLDDVFRYVSRRLSVRAEAEDVTAETFAAAFSSLQQIQRQSDPLPYLLGIARRKLIDRARKQKRQPAPIALDESLADPGRSPEEQLLADERAAELHALLDSLKPEQREALLLQHIEGLSQNQIGAVLGKSPAAVNSLLQRGRATLAARGAAYFLPESTEERR